MLQDYEVLVNGKVVTVTRVNPPKLGAWVRGLYLNEDGKLVKVFGFVEEVL